MKKTANTTTNTNATVNTSTVTTTADNAKEAQFLQDLGRLIVKYYLDEIPFKKAMFVLNSDMTQAEEPTITPAPKAEPTKVELLKQYGKNGLKVKNASAVNVTEKATDAVNKIANLLDIKVKTHKDGNRKGYLNCPNTAAAIIDRYDGGDKLVKEAISILIDTEHLDSYHGITRKELELVTRILALHQKRGRSKVKEALRAILKEHTTDSILVLAKNTKKYVQRSDIDMMVLWVESEIAKVDGVRNQLEK